ncbi:carbon-nitrogen hydrolase family protein [Kutzneria sp. CA-103260]|uniref:carbon-nitrogen hydrolase family protein n=1 Tax=Kutzneria sp. CA-103260 TaxID=2802641 RepID=UPI001BF0C217|nr:carbon-nitrogen hydrolase family protein [Kutzneria sp. CA-103260]QUQ63050.1 carbon-nitrogen hydrolase family protein [Kutzneria sp. CA-103260]
MHPGMSLPVVLAQAEPVPFDRPLEVFAAEVEALLTEHPGTRLVMYPELHLCRAEQPADAAEPLDGPRTRQLAQIAGDLGVWLAPGSLCERGPAGELFNTAVAFSPGGELVASYRKVFPWRPYEPYDPGDRFVVFDLPEGRVGFAICYDAWFPEITRHLAWMGAELVLNPVQTTTRDRAQELVLARANAIVNQVFVASLNVAGPFGMGCSLVVGPEGQVLAETPGAEPAVLALELDLTEVARVREHGTAGLNRMWDQFTESDAPIELPLYQGRIEPGRWRPGGGDPR